MSFPHRRRLSCGTVLLNEERELLLCHVTGQSHWDLPKGGIDPDETPLQAALRETREEAGLDLPPDSMLDLGRFPYTNKKNLHLYAALLPRIDVKTLTCTTHYQERYSGRQVPEMDGYGWFSFDRVATLCTPKMAQVLTVRIDLPEVLGQLLRRPAVVPAVEIGAAGPTS